MAYHPPISRPSRRNTKSFLCWDLKGSLSNAKPWERWWGRRSIFILYAWTAGRHSSLSDCSHHIEHNHLLLRIRPSRPCLHIFLPGMHHSLETISSGSIVHYLNHCTKSFFSCWRMFPPKWCQPWDLSISQCSMHGTFFSEIYLRSPGLWRKTIMFAWQTDISCLQPDKARTTRSLPGKL